jgi:hypothetical protein
VHCDDVVLHIVCGSVSHTIGQGYSNRSSALLDGVPAIRHSKEHYATHDIVIAVLQEHLDTRALGATDARAAE